MICDPLRLRTLELLTRGHRLYGGGQVDAGVLGGAELLPEHADRSARVGEGTADTGAAAARRIHQAAAELRSSAATDAALSGLLDRARDEGRLGWQATRTVLADAVADTAPAADTPLGRREALRRTTSRLHTQHRLVRRSRRRAGLLAGRLRQLSYPDRRQAPGIPVEAVHYHRRVTPGRSGRQITAALDRLGITDPAARRRWLRGYLTLIARESGGRAWAVASEPATAPGSAQPDGHGLGYARGLTQTIPATFARFHQPGTSTNIYDPVANICASMNYVMHRYGVRADGADLAALVQQADPRRPPKGY